MGCAGEPACLAEVLGSCTSCNGSKRNVLRKGCGRCGEGTCLPRVWKKHGLHPRHVDRVGGMSNHVCPGGRRPVVAGSRGLGGRVSTNPRLPPSSLNLAFHVGRLAQAKNKACVRQFGVPDNHVGTSGPAHLGHGAVGRGVVHNPSGHRPCAGSAFLAGRYFRVVLAPSRQTSPSGVDPPVEPAVGLFRSWSWWKGATADSTAWK